MQWHNPHSYVHDCCIGATITATFIDTIQMLTNRRYTGRVFAFISLLSLINCFTKSLNIPFALCIIIQFCFAENTISRLM